MYLTQEGLMARWYAGAVISRVNENGDREYLVIDTRSTNQKYSGRPMQTKFCGGTEEFHEIEDTTILKTLRRETFEETHMVIRDGASPLMIHTENLPGHFKSFYDIDWSDLEGTLRTSEKVIEGDWMSAPYWVSFETACRLLFRSHQPALLKSEERFKTKQKAAVSA